MRRVRALPVVLALALLTSVACSGGGESAESTTAASSPADGTATPAASPAASGSDAAVSGPQADLATFEALTAPEQEQQLAQLSTPLEEALLASEGQQPDPAVLDAYRKVVDEITRMARDQEPTFTFGRTGGLVRAEDSGLGGLWFGSMLSVPTAVTLALGATGDVAPGKAQSGTRENADGKGTSTLTVSGALDHVTVDWTMAADFDDVKGTLKITASMDPCPDPNGMFRATITSAMATKGAARSATSTTLEVTGLIDDSAHLLGYDSTARTQAARGGTRIADVTTKTTHSGEELTLASVGANQAEAGTAQDGEQWSVVGMINQSMYERQIVSEVMAAIEKGRCVRLTATPTPAQTRGVDPSTPFTIDALPRSLVDGQPTGGTVTGTLSGGSSLDPAGTPTPADAQFAYVAPDEENKTASVTLEARSIRGVGRAIVDFDTSAVRGWVIGEKVGPYQFEAVSCGSAAGPWKIVYEIQNMAPITGGGTIKVTFPSVPSNEAPAVDATGSEKGLLTVPGGGVRFGGPVQATLAQAGSQYTMTLTSSGMATGFAQGKQATKKMAAETFSLDVRPASTSCQ